MPKTNHCRSTSNPVAFDCTGNNCDCNHYEQEEVFLCGCNWYAVGFCLSKKAQKATKNDTRRDRAGSIRRIWL